VIRRLFVLLAASVTVAATLATVPATADDLPAAHETAPVPMVGPLFFPSVLGLFEALRFPHFCSASVLHSTSRNLVVTAAHCVYGAGPTIEFAPGYDGGATPYGVWTVRHLYVDPAWRSTRDPRHDVAILAVAPRAGRNIEDVVGAHPLGVPQAGVDVTVLGYRLGSGDRPITCTNRLHETDGFPSIDCTGITDGTSGGPWLQDGSVVGVIGGLEQGGCADTEYSAPFGADTAALLHRAESGRGPDLAPVAFLANRC
jgi:hypothetical protein